MPDCPSCHSPVPDGQRFCGDCGDDLDRTSAPTETNHRPGFPETAPRPCEERNRFVPGTTVAKRYRIVSLLGRGGMGEVYRADDLKLGQPVALKFLPSRFENRPDRLGRLLNEVRMARQVTHPNVCRVYDVGEVDGHHFLSMEYVDGEDLASLLRRIGHFPKDKAVQVARQLCAGLAGAHEQGILHRDLKPANVLIDGRGQAKITDFGLAALSDQIDGADIPAGTPAYMAPEQRAGKEVTTASDLFALGLVLYELFTGRMAYPGTSGEEIARLQTESTPTTPSDHVDGLDPVVDRVILRCLAVDPAERPPSALAVAAALPGGDPLAAALLAGETPSPEMVAAAGVAETLQPGRALSLASAAVVLFIGGISLMGHYGLHAYLPLDKPPAVLTDRATEIVGQLGYTEPVYADPADTTIGYSFRSTAYDRLRDEGSAERLRDPEAGVLQFWYRQGPHGFKPETGKEVTRWDPFPQTTGEILVSLGMDGRLETFVALPRRYREASATEAESAEYDWSLPFQLAGLDMTDFKRTEPRYQRFMQTDQRAAWEPRDPATPFRIEAGANEGRLSLFATLGLEEAERLAAEPRESSAEAFDVLNIFFILLFFISILVARANLRRGRADVRSAVRLGGLMAGLVLVSGAAISHVLVNELIMAVSVWTGVMSAMVYLAFEPHVRRIWPSMLVSWTRLMGRSELGGRDPVVGRAVLAGLLAGGSMVLLAGFILVAVLAREGIPGFVDLRGLPGLLGQRHIWSLMAERLGWGVMEALVLTLLMVLGRFIVRRPIPAAVVAGTLWFLPDIIGALLEPPSTRVILIGGGLLLVDIVAMLVVLLRWGLVGVMTMSVTTYLGGMVPTSDWSAWHAQPGILCTILLAAIAAYGYWAATPGRRRMVPGERVERA